MRRSCSLTRRNTRATQAESTGRPQRFQIPHGSLLEPCRAGLIWAALTLLAASATSASAADAAAPASSQAGTYDPSAMLDRYFERLSAPHHLRFTSLEEWKTRRAELRRKVLRDIGLDPLPARLPLRTAYGGRLERGDYVVQRVYWQTWPDVYASGYLYLPRPDGRRPAILNPHGHWNTGARHAVIQSRCIALAKKGYVCLAPDSVHIPQEGYLIGASSVGVMTYNAIRALDLLESLPEVDAGRIGCTGESGGGQQTMFLMGVDDRLAAAVPVVMVSYYRRIMSPPGFPHCYCNVVPGIVRDADEPEMTATFAPRPALYLCVTGDWTRDFPKEEYPELQSIHALYGAASNIGMQQWESGHDYSRPMRERMYAFFNRHLRDVDDPAQAVEPELKIETLETLDALNQPPAGARPAPAVIDWYKQQYAFKPESPRDAAAWRRYQESLRRRISDLLGDEPVKGRAVGPSEAVTLMGRKARRLLVQSEPDIRFPVALAAPDESERRPVVILIHEKGIKGVEESHAELITSLLTGEIAVAVAEVRLTGSLARNWSLDCIMWGRPEVGMALTDLRACLDVLAEQHGIDSRRVILAGSGGSGLTALFAAAMEPRLSGAAALELGPTYAQGRNRPLIANLLRVADLPQIASAIAPRRLLAGGVRPDACSFTVDAYRRMNAAGGLTLQEEPVTPEALASWVLKQAE